MLRIFKRFFIPIPLLAAIILTSWLVEATSSAPPALTSSKFQRFKKSQTIPSLLKLHGFSDRQVFLALKSNPLPRGLSLSHGESYKVSRSTDGRHVEIRIFEPIRNRVIVFWRWNTPAKAKVPENQTVGSYSTTQDFAVKTRKVEGRVRGSLLTSIMERLPDEWTAYRFMDAYNLDFNLPRALQRGAKFSFVVETKWDGKDMVGYGQILETTLAIGSGWERRVFVSFPGGGSFINPAKLHDRRPLFAPVNYLRISSLFEPRRLHPIKRKRQPHLGIDFELHEGEDVFAADNGVVIRTGRQRAAGNFIVLRHASGLETYYNHLQEVTPGLAEGSRVANGQRIGAIGCTGYCTKAHLHFAVKKNGRFVDPSRLVKSYPFRSQRIVTQYSE